MARTEAVTHGVLDPLDQRVVKVSLVARRHDDEQKHRLVLVVLPPPAHTQRIGQHRIERRALDDVVDLRRPEPNAARIQHAVGAAQDLHAAGPRVHQDEIMLGPDIEPRSLGLPLLGLLTDVFNPESLKIRLVVFLVSGVAPEAARHRGEGVAADELAGLAGQGDGVAGRGVEDVAVVAERPHLHFVGVDGARRVGGHPGAGDVGAARDGRQVDRARKRAVEPLELLACQGRPGRGDEPETRQVERRHRNT